jgi:hypothetical protein
VQRLARNLSVEPLELSDWNARENAPDNDVEHRGDDQSYPEGLRTSDTHLWQLFPSPGTLEVNMEISISVRLRIVIKSAEQALQSSSLLSTETSTVDTSLVGTLSLNDKRPRALSRTEPILPIIVFSAW